jgi:diadenosine tetraphosphate (Ap4A) HIT family hydrolase
MNSKVNCRFCEIVNGKYSFVGIDEPIWSNNEFVAVASIGAFIDGWTLIIPKEHQFSMKNLYEDQCFTDISKIVVSHLCTHYGPLIAFEHGANKCGSQTGCGIDHAHLHIVPLNKPLLPDIKDSQLKWIPCRASEILERSANNEYLFYAEIGNKDDWQNFLGYLHILETPISQFFRRLIAKQTGYADQCDYKRFPHIDTALKTHRILASSFA